MKLRLRKNKALIVLIAAVTAVAALTLLTAFGVLNFRKQPQAAEAGTSVRFIDVGQGDCTLAVSEGHALLIDTGEYDDRDAVISYLKSLNITRLDCFILTHPHSDHIGSMSYIVRHFNIGSVLMPKVAANTEMYENLLKSIESKELTVKNPKAGLKIIRGDDFSARVLGPQEISEDNYNNDSLVIRLDYKDATFLFMGDAERDEIESITADMSADVLKVGHHGSANATYQSFLDKVQPQIAVISCGENNDYGHPHKNVLKLLKQIDCEVHRTDKEGTVAVSSDGRSYEVETGLESIVRSK